MKIMITDKNSSPSNELLVNLHESGRNEERKVTRSHKETWAAPSTTEKVQTPVILTPKASLLTKKEPFLRMRESGQLFMLIHDMEEIRRCRFPRWSQQSFDIMTRQPDGSRRWDSITMVLMKALAHKGARDSDDGYWLHLIHDGSTKK